jgi:hypothetical protein
MKNNSPLGSVVERITSNDKVISSILIVGIHSYFCSAVKVEFQPLFDRLSASMFFAHIESRRAMSPICTTEGTRGDSAWADCTKTKDRKTIWKSHRIKDLALSIPCCEQTPNLLMY